MLLKFTGIEVSKSGSSFIMAEALENNKIKGVIGEVGLQRVGDRFNAFNLTINMVVDPGGTLSYDKGEQLMQQFRKQLLGKKVEIAEIIVPCPICGKGFNTEQGMKQHMRMVHKEKKKTTKKSKKTTDTKKKKQTKTSRSKRKKQA